MRDFLLQSHCATVAFVFYLRPYLSWHFRGARSFLARVLENTKPLESLLLDKVQQRLKFRFRFAGETDDKSCTQCDSGNAQTQLRDQCFNMRATGLASHSPNHRLIDVLQRDVDITRDVAALGDS